MSSAALASDNWAGGDWPPEMAASVGRETLEQQLRRPEQQRALLAAALADMPGGVLSYSASNLRADRSMAQRSRAVLRNGEPGLIAHVWDGSLTTNAAVRIAAQPREAQADVMDRVDRGYLIAAVLGPRPRTKGHAAAPLKPRVRSRPTSQFVTLTQTEDTLRVMAEHTLDPIDDLDPAITAAQAFVLMTRLSQHIASLNRVKNMLKKRTQL